MLSQIQGCLLGCALGDAFGAPFEGGPLERLTWAVLGRTRGFKRRFSDDTQMSLDLAESLARCIAVDSDDLAKTFARNYSWTRGYGPGAAKILKRIDTGVPWQTASRSVYPDGSFGNGAAMRAPILGVLFEGVALEQAVVAASIVTHAHPLGIDGARVVAAVAQAAAAKVTPGDWLEVARSAAHTDEFRQKLHDARLVTADAVSLGHFGNTVAALDSVPTALVLAKFGVEHDFDAMLKLAQQVGGDVDTLAAMAGALFGISRPDDLPQNLLQRVEGVDAIKRVAAAVHRRFFESN